MFFYPEFVDNKDFYFLFFIFKQINPIHKGNNPVPCNLWIKCEYYFIPTILGPKKTKKS